jgi:glycosyltransferase involved in cell wall biosynthesis
MRIACVGNGWFPEASSGLERYLDATARELTARGNDVDLFVVGSPQAWDARARAFALAASGASMPARLLGAAGVLARRARGPYDVVNMHFAMYAWQTYLAVPRTAARVVTFHGPWADESQAESKSALRTKVMHAVERSVYAKSDRFIVLSQAFRDILSNRYGVDTARIDVIPGGVDVDRFNVAVDPHEARRRLGWPQDGPLAFVARRLVRRTGVIELIDAIERVKAQGVKLTVMMAGRGYLDAELRAKIERAGLAEWVKLIGFVPDDELPLAYRAADFVIVPSQGLEGFGLTVTESLACGTPPLVTPVGGLPEVVAPLAADLVLAGSDPGALAAGIIGVVRTPQRLPAREVCRTYALSRFQWKHVAAQVEASFAKTSAQRTLGRRPVAAI